MRGLNSRPLPQGQVTVHNDGGRTLIAGTRRYEVRPNGAVAGFQANGVTAALRTDGRFRSVRTPDMSIRDGWRGGRSIVLHRPDGATLVSTGRSGGYLERPIVLGGRGFIERSYMFHGAVTPRYFRPYRYRGILLPAYIPRMYYPLSFYAWMSRPWQGRARYAWPWLGMPWYMTYGGYFAPAEYYDGAYPWLADYVLAETLSGGYQDDAQVSGDAGDVPATPPDDVLYAEDGAPITADLKAALAEELRRHVDAEGAMAQGGQNPSQVDLAGSLNPGRLFLVSLDLEVKAGEQTCALSHGDILRVAAPPSPAATAALLRVVAGKRYDCPAGTQVTVFFQDLQEMLNDLRAQMDAGLDVLRAGQGIGGLPAAPPAAMAAPRPGMPGAPPADAGVDALLANERNQAAQTESAVSQAAFGVQP